MCVIVCCVFFILCIVICFVVLYVCVVLLDVDDGGFIVMRCVECVVLLIEILFFLCVYVVIELLVMFWMFGLC